MLLIGVDPGLTGAMACICTRRGLLDVADLPTQSNGTATGSMKRWLDVLGVAELLGGWSQRYEFAAESVHAAIERPIAMPSLPAQTIASQFDTYGVLRALLAGVVMLGGSVEHVAPNVWKKALGLGSEKDASRALCQRLYPQAPITRVKDHNRAEAILIGHWLLQEIA